MDNYQPKKLHDLEQLSATVAENYPPMWRRVYLNAIQEGFTEEQAFKIVLVMVNGMMGGRMNQ